jgi:hypothetical protein
LERIPEEDVLAPDVGLFVDSSKSPFREAAFDLTPEAMGTGAFVSLLRFLPNFFFAVGSDDCCEDFVAELIRLTSWLTLELGETRKEDVQISIFFSF